MSKRNKARQPKIKGLISIRGKKINQNRTMRFWFSSIVWLLFAITAVSTGIIFILLYGILTFRQIYFNVFLLIAAMTLSSVIIGALAVSVASPMLTYIGSLFESTSLAKWGGTVLKALGIALIVQICSDICKDCGENSAALGVELIGKLEIVALCIPLLQSILTTAREVLKW